MRASQMLAVWVLAASSSAWAGETIVNPYAPTGRPVHLDFTRLPEPRPDGGVAFEDLDDYKGRPVLEHPRRGALPAGWVQQGGVVIPQAVADGADVRASALEVTDAPHPSAADKVLGPDAADLCEFPELTPGGVYTGEFKRGSEYPRHGTVYMNFVGAKMQSGGENSAENQSLLALGDDYPYPMYANGEEVAIAVAQAVQADFADMAVRVVFAKRPPKMLPYVMIMMGGHYSDTSAGPSGGVAPGADCEDVGLRNVCYAFVNLQPINAQANVASQEIGHTMGLGHTYGNDRVMAFGYDTNSPIDMGFGAECTEVFIAQGQGAYCAGVNKCHCGSDGKMQHDLRTLQAIYDAPGPDMIPPTIMITAPTDGAHFESGETVNVTVAPEDDFGGYGWQLVIKNADTDKVLAEAPDYDVAQIFSLAGLPDGRYTLLAQVSDHADQIGEHEITITIGEVASMDSESAPTTSAGEASGEAGGSSGEASGGSGSTASEEEVDDGCNCRHTSARGSLALATLGLLGLRRRRSARELSGHAGPRGARARA